MKFQFFDLCWFFQRNVFRYAGSFFEEMIQYLFDRGNFVLRSAEFSYFLQLKQDFSVQLNFFCKVIRKFGIDLLQKNNSVYGSQARMLFAL